jgi:hypothetical protein
MMPENKTKDRYIPFRKRDIVQMLIQDKGLKSKEEESKFLKFVKMVESIFHFEFHEELETLKDAYFPLDPDQPKWCPLPTQEVESSKGKLFDTLHNVLNKANFETIPQEEIDKAYETGAAVDLHIDVDKNDFEDIRFYSRGDREDKIIHYKWFGLKKYESRHTILERVVMLVRFKDKEYFETRKKNDIQFEPGSTMIKLFKDVPKEDLEMLFPNAKVSMSLKDKLLLIVPALVGGVPLLITKVLPALLVVYVILTAYFGLSPEAGARDMKQAIVAISAAAALGGFLMKQWTKYKNMRYEFQKILSDNLYFRNLVNNVGVFHSLIDSAEEEECKEAFIAYYFLYVTEDEMDEGQLDHMVEDWFLKQHNCELDFECPDALDKLMRLKLIERREDGVLKAQEFDEALRRLDERWDNYFQYNV